MIVFPIFVSHKSCFTRCDLFGDVRRNYAEASDKMQKYFYLFFLFAYFSTSTSSNLFCLPRDATYRWTHRKRCANCNRSHFEDHKSDSVIRTYRSLLDTIDTSFDWVVPPFGWFLTDVSQNGYNTKYSTWWR